MFLFRNNINDMLYKIENNKVTCKRDKDSEWRYSGFKAEEILGSIARGKRAFSELIISLENE